MEYPSETFCPICPDCPKGLIQPMLKRDDLLDLPPVLKKLTLKKQILNSI
jgi:hypothetical protein